MPYEEPAKNLYMPGREAAAGRAKAWTAHEAERLGISPEAIARFALAVGSQGNVRSKTLQAFTEDQFQEIVQSLP